MLAAASVALLAAVVLIAMLVGRWPALAVALAGSLALNWFFANPVHTLRINRLSDAVTVAVVAAMAIAVSMLLNHAVARGVTDALRRPHENETLDLGDLQVDFGRKRVTKNGADVALTPTEWSFFELLARNVGQLVPRDQILTTVWGPMYVKETHYLRVYIGQLRRKLEDDPGNPRHLITSSGMGYTLEP